MKSTTPDAECAEGVLQTQPPIWGVNLSNNISIPRAKISNRVTEREPTFETS